MENIVICGGGIIGCATAYYLAKKGVKCTVVERVSIACASSGKAGGFLARDWCDHSELGSLAHASYDLHMQLAKEFPQCDYREVDTLDVKLKEGKGKRLPAKSLPSWIDGPVTSSSSIGDKSNTAQVHPFKLTNLFIEEAKRLTGSDVVIGTVDGIELSPEGTKVTGVKVNGAILPADVVILTMGPWTHQACDWLKIPAVRGSRAHSIVMRPQTDDVTAHCLFTSFSGMESPEIYPRPDSTVYACGFSDKIKLPNDPSTITPNTQSCQKLKEICGKISSSLANADVENEQVCYLPTPNGHLPIIGAVPHVQGAYMAAGHTCWGIMNAPGTGAALAELVVHGECKLLDLDPFQPANFL